jgi:hypothetical protein
MATRNTHVRAQLQDISFTDQQSEQKADHALGLTTISSMRQTFVNEWVMTRVTTRDKADTPIRGEVLKHDPHKGVVYQTAKRYLAQHPTARLFIFFAGDPIPQEVEAMLVLG